MRLYLSHDCTLYVERFVIFFDTLLAIFETQKGNNKQKQMQRNERQIHDFTHLSPAGVYYFCEKTFIVRLQKYTCMRFFASFLYQEKLLAPGSYP
jgi:hypothetical protein